MGGLPETDVSMNTPRSQCAFCVALAELAQRLTRDDHAPPSPSPARRRFAGSLAAMGVAAALPAFAREGVEVGQSSKFAQLIPAEEVEQAAAQQYSQLMQQARQQGALAPESHPQVQRLRYIAKRMIPFCAEWNPRAPQWHWEVNLVGSKQINAFCMPGGKIAFFSALLIQLKLNDDEVAMVMGHETAHALREHARERMGKTAATSGAIELGAALLGLGSGSRMLANMGGQLLTLKFSRDDESEADLVGMELAARAGYDPRSGVVLWQKMGAATGGGGDAGGVGSKLAEYGSTHPQGPTRIRDIQANLPKVMPLYERAPKPDRHFEIMQPLQQQQ